MFSTCNHWSQVSLPPVSSTFSSRFRILLSRVSARSSSSSWQPVRGSIRSPLSTRSLFSPWITRGVPKSRFSLQPSSLLFPTSHLPPAHWKIAPYPQTPLSTRIMVFPLVNVTPFAHSIAFQTRTRNFGLHSSAPKDPLKQAPLGCPCPLSLDRHTCVVRPFAVRLQYPFS